MLYLHILFGIEEGLKSSKIQKILYLTDKKRALNIIIGVLTISLHRNIDIQEFRFYNLVAKVDFLI